MSGIYEGQIRVIDHSTPNKFKTACTIIRIAQVHEGIAFYVYPELLEYSDYYRDIDEILAHTTPSYVYEAQQQFDKDLEELLND
jgi:hypothetical protein